jgi:inner membrane protein
MQSSWPDPSFTGGRLPDTSEINKNGFTARWKSLFHTRNFPQVWKDDSYDLSLSSFGTDLFIPVNGYQKTMRAVKYAILCILLTFVAFFLIETNNKKSAHPLQYALIGFALILFYTLLLSFSEYIGFNTAYAIAAVATIGLIAWFVRGILQSGKSTTLLSIVLILVYSYVFTILQLQDYALILGSIGLFFTLGVIMYFSRKIRW